MLTLLFFTTNLIFQKVENTAALNLIFIITKMMPVKVLRIMGENE